MSDELQNLRASIDAIDAEMLKLLNSRAENAQAIGRLKKGVAYRPDREAQVLRRIKEINTGPLSDETAALLFREIMSACLALERPLTVAYLGPVGTFSQAAAVKQFGHAAQALPQPSIDTVFRTTEAGEADFCVVPVENSTEGAIGRTLDLLIESPLKICGEVVLRIHHHLLCKEERALEKIAKVYSHAQSLAQCHEWLNSHMPVAQRIPVASNAEAARMAAEEAGAAAIAGEMAGEQYNLIGLAKNIEDEPNNTTRFLVLGRDDYAASGRDKTSLVLSTKNRPGAVHDLLTPLAQNGVSMTKFESRPLKSVMWEYVFFIDIEGHKDDAIVIKTLDELKQRTSFMKVLGSYPVAVL
ncbi:MAG: prephenate dehydratase [Burkholderiales bacterium]